MNNRRNYYRILHVQPDAPTQVIRASYRTLMQRMKLHPDLGGDTATASLVNEAWAVLRDERARAEYDRTFDPCHGAGRKTARREPRADRRETSPPADETTTRTRSAPDCCHFCALPHGPVASIDLLDDCAGCGGPLYPAQKQSASEDSQRAIDRLDRRHPLTFFVSLDAATARSGQTRDISPNGLQFVTDQPPAAGEVIRLTTPVCAAVARVVNARRAGDRDQARWQVGVTFLTLRFERASGTFVSATA